MPLEQASRKCVSNFNFIVSNPINSISHRVKKVTVTRSGPPRKAPLPASSADSTFQPCKLLQCVPMVTGKGVAEGKQRDKASPQHLKTFTLPALCVIHSILKSPFIKRTARDIYVTHM